MVKRLSSFSMKPYGCNRNWITPSWIKTRYAIIALTCNITLAWKIQRKSLSLKGTWRFHSICNAKFLCWNFVTNTATFRGFSTDSLDIYTWLGSSLHFISKRLTQLGGGRFICWYYEILRRRIAEQGKWDWNWSRATRNLPWPVLNYNESSVTFENCQHQSSRCNKNHWSWRWCFWRSTPRHTLS